MCVPQRKEECVEALVCVCVCVCVCVFEGLACVKGEVWGRVHV